MGGTWPKCASVTITLYRQQQRRRIPRLLGTPRLPSCKACQPPRTSIKPVRLTLITRKFSSVFCSLSLCRSCAPLLSRIHARRNPVNSTRGARSLDSNRARRDSPPSMSNVERRCASSHFGHCARARARARVAGPAYRALVGPDCSRLYCMY